MTVMRALVTMPQNDALPENWATNSWHFEDNTTDPLDTAAAVVDRLTAFYQAIDGQAFGAQSSLNFPVDVYDLAEPEPRVPILMDSISIVPNASLNFPNEVAICLSFQGAAVSGQSQARRRGRVFLGPISSISSNFTNASGGTRPSSVLRNAILDAAEPLMVPDPVTGLRLVVFSPTTRDAGGSLGESTTDVVQLSVDDAWDTQRRRGLSPTARSVRNAA